MKNIVWLVQTNGIDYRHVSKIWDAAKKYSKVEEAVVVPFKTTLDNEFDAKEKYVIPYGSVRLSKIGLIHGWQGIYQSDYSFNSEIWFENRPDMLNSDSISLSIKELQDLPVNGKIFIRPSLDHKAFTGFVATKKGILDLAERAEIEDNVNFDMNTRVSVSSVKSIEAEYRYFVIGGKVVSGSLYAQMGVPMTQPVTEKCRLKMAQAAANEWLPHETCVMDLADTNEGCKVIEFNAFNSSGFYYHDVDNIVKSVVEWENNR